MRQRSASFRRAAAPVLLTVLAACGGESKSIGELIQSGEHEAALTAIQARRAEVDKGSPAELELVLQHVEAAAEEQPASARDAFLGFAEAHPDAVSARDYRDAVSQLRTYGKYVEAIEVMHAGKQRWADDEVIGALLAMLQKDAETSPEAANKLKGLGYSSK